MEITTDFDINVWDYVGYNTDYDEGPGWRLSIHFLEEDETGYVSTGRFIDELYLDLTDEEAKELTLGWDEDLGGYYIGDSDFFIQRDSFIETYKSIPPRVTQFLEAVQRELTNGVEPYRLVR